MRIDPGNPLFRYIDKLLLAVAALTALLGLLRVSSSDTPARRAVVKVQQALDDLDRAVVNKQVRNWDPPDDHARLAERFNSQNIQEGNPFRLYVFFSPDEIIGEALTVKYDKATSVDQRETAYYPITKKYGEALPVLKKVDYTKASLVIGAAAKKAAQVTLDREQKRLAIIPLAPGLGSVRIEFAEGASFEFKLTIVEIEVSPIAVPQPPAKLTATARKGYIALTWETNPKSSPATEYIIYRSEDPDAPEQEVGRHEVGGIEDRTTTVQANADEPPAAIIRRYQWDDFGVSPGTKYYYAIKTSGMVKEEGKEEATLIFSALNPNRASAVALSPISLTLVGGVARRSPMGTFEVEVQEGYTPNFKNFFARPGEQIGAGEYSSGFTLVGIEQLPHEHCREMAVLVKVAGQHKIQHKEVRYVQQDLRAVVVNGQNASTVLWKKQGGRSRYQKAVRKLFKEIAAIADGPLPRAKREGDAKGKPELAVTNEADDTLIIVARGGRDEKMLEVPPHSERPIKLTPGGYEIVAGYLVKTANEDNVEEIDRQKSKAYRAEKVKLEQSKKYRLRIGKPERIAPAAIAPAGGKKEAEE